MPNQAKGAHYGGADGTGQNSVPWSIPLTRTLQTETARHELRAHIPTLGSVERLYLTLRGGVLPAVDGTDGTFRVLPDPGGQGQKTIRHRDGWGWTCVRCGREVEGDPATRPARCAGCKCMDLQGGIIPLFYLAGFSGGGSGYCGGIEHVDWLCGFGFWTKAVAGWSVYRAVDGWVMREPLRHIQANLGKYGVTRSHTWVRVAVQNVRAEWERDGAA